ncbi:hypothetical protein OG21DRAFT_1512959 [Imleria badia]|nr:hypothetical protein OG21DRAFT_1512959 [Imleria badia]
MAYTIGLVSVLESSFDFTLKPDLAGTTNWEVLKQVFDTIVYTMNVQTNAKRFITLVDCCRNNPGHFPPDGRETVG